jgi:NDP-sugar pyrophosphorylase family protein
MKAMLFAAGLGTRLKPFTDNKPKALVEINGVALLEMVIKRLIFFGFNEIIINVHHYSQQIIEFLSSKNNFDIRIEISDESALLLDTGGGLKKAGHFFNDGKPFLVHNVDILSDIDLNLLYKAHLQHNYLATLACTERPSTRHFLINNENELCGWKNEKTGEVIISKETNLYLKPIAFCGIQIISPEFLGLINETGTFSIINTYLRLATVNAIKVMPFQNLKWIDIGSLENYKKAQVMNF